MHWAQAPGMNFLEDLEDFLKVQVVQFLQSFH